jgi:hypothetical protein
LLSTAPRAAWLRRALVYIIKAIGRREVDDVTAALAGEWLSSLPAWVAEPSIGIGDDGSISIEWDRAEKVLHVMFDEVSTDAYFADARSGEEWEMTVAADTGPLLNALRRMSPSSTQI